LDRTVPEQAAVAQRLRRRTGYTRRVGINDVGLNGGASDGTEAAASDGTGSAGGDAEVSTWDFGIAGSVGTSVAGKSITVGGRRRFVPGEARRTLFVRHAGILNDSIRALA
jgi:hypothetical protein